MRVLFITPDLFGPPGGIARVSRLVCKSLSESSAVKCLDVLALNDAQDQQPNYNYLPTLHYSYHSFGGNKIGFLRELLQLSANKYDVFLTSHVNLALPLWLLQRLLRKRTILVSIAHGIDVWERLPWFRRFPLINSSIILSVSNLTKERMIQTNGVASEKVFILHNCLDPNFISVEDQKIQSTAIASEWIHKPCMLTVSRLTKHDRYKGHTQVIHALALTRKQLPLLQYYIVGEGDLIPELQQLCRQLDVVSAVHFLGQVDESILRLLYTQTDLFIMPSKGEGFGLVYLEAMAYGIPVIASTQDAAGEVVQHNKTGLLVDPDDITALTNSIVLLLTDNPLRQQMGELGREIVREKFGYRIFKENLVGYLLQALVTVEQ